MRLLKPAWLMVVALLLITDCARNTAFPYGSHVDESRSFFLAHKAELTALVKAAKEDGYTDVSYSVSKGQPWIVLVRRKDFRGRLVGPDRERYETLFKRAEIGKVWKTEGCYNVGVAHPDPEYDFTATFEAPCEVTYKEPDCRSLTALPPRGSCEIRLQDGWKLVYLWTPPIDRSRTE